MVVCERGKEAGRERKMEKEGDREAKEWRGGGVVVVEWEEDEGQGEAKEGGSLYTNKVAGHSPPGSQPVTDDARS